MDFSDRGAAPISFQIAPLIDIVFLLLIWMIVSYAVAQEEKNLQIRLPRASTAVEVPRASNDIVIDIAADGTVTHQRRPMTLAALERRLVRLAEFARGPEVGLEPGVILRVDASTPHRAVVEVLDVCGRAEVRRVFFATDGGLRPVNPDPAPAS